MTAIYDFLLHINATVPAWLVAALLGWLVSVSVTQPLKFVFHLNTDPLDRQLWSRALAFVSGFVTVAYLVPTLPGFILALAVGVWSPLAFWLLMKVLDGRFPGLRDFLSGDVRGLMKRDPQENRP